MARSIWSGTVSFGLVNVPVKLYSAVSKKTVRFHQLAGEDNARVQQKRVSSATGEEVPYEQIVKGYEIAPDQYVVIRPEELEALDPKATRTIEISDFVDLADIDPMFFDTPYYLAPATGAAKSYALLARAMEEEGKVAIARFVMRQKEYLAAIRAVDGALVLETMNFADEVVDRGTIDELDDAADIEASDREIAMARQLIETLASEFEPARYHDTYREAVLDLIERKAAGEEIAIQPEAPAPAEVPDLMAALEASIKAVKSRGDGDGAAAPAKRQAAKRPAAKRSRSGSDGSAKKRPAKKA